MQNDERRWWTRSGRRAASVAADFEVLPKARCDWGSVRPPRHRFLAAAEVEESGEATWWGIYLPSYNFAVVLPHYEPSDADHQSCLLREQALTLYGHIKTAEQRTIIQQYGDWYTGRWWVGCYIWYSEERPGRTAAPPSTLIPHRCTKCPPINGQCTNFISFDVAL